MTQQTGEQAAQNQAGLSGRLHLPVGELRLSTYLLARHLNNPIPPRIIVVRRTASGTRLEYGARWQPSEFGAALIVGGEGDWQRDDRRNWVNIRGERGALTLDQLEHVRSFAPFGQLSATLGRGTMFIGLRHDKVRFEAADRLITPTNPDDSGERTMGATTYSLGLSYARNATFEMYVNTGTAFQTPTTTELANQVSGAGGFNSALEPERIHSTEGGVRGVAGHGIQYQLSIYTMRVVDELVPFEVPSAPGRQFYQNVGSATHRGGEGQVQYPITRWFGVRAGYTYVSTSVTVDTFSVVSPKKLPGVAPHIGTLGLDFGNPLRQFASVEFRAQSAIPVNTLNTAHSAGYLVTNLRAAALITPRWRLVGGVGNVFNVLYNTSVVINASGGRYYEPAAERTFFLGTELR